MNDVQIFVQDRHAQTQARKDARSRVAAQLMQGKMPTFEDLATSRGLVIRARHNSIFSDAWTPLAIVFLFVGLLLNRNPAFLALGAVLLIIVGISSWWKANSLIGVDYERQFDRTRVFPGEKITMTLVISNHKPLPLTWLKFDDRIPVAPQEEGKMAEVIGATAGYYNLQNIFSISGHGRLTHAITLVFKQRGYHQVGPVTYQSGDIFTLFTVEEERDYLDTLVIYPAIYPLEDLGLPAKEPFGELKVQRSLFTDPIKTQGIRDYQPQDRFRDVHWKATARRGHLQTKIYDPSTGMTLVIFLNVATFARHWMGYNPQTLERAISVAASIANYGAEHKWGIGLYVNGSVPRSDQPIRVHPGRNPEQLTHILEALAATTEFATGSIERLMQVESPRLPWAATLVLVTAFVTDEMAIILTRLREAGRKVALISLAETLPPSLPGIISYHIPPNVPAFANQSPTEATLSTIPHELALEMVTEQ